MPRRTDERIALAEEMYRDGERLVDIAGRLNLPAGTVRRWKCTYKWDNERPEEMVDAQKDSERPEGKVNAQKGGERLPKMDCSEYRRKHPNLDFLTDEELEKDAWYRETYAWAEVLTTKERWELIREIEAGTAKAGPTKAEQDKMMRERRINTQKAYDLFGWG